MATKIFVNLPVQDLNRSIAFFEALGFRCNRQFTDDTAACMVISDEIYAMLLTHAKYRQIHQQRDC
jgi:predicted lactoylglutathione lyase